MQEFKLQIDTNTIYIQAIRFIGSFVLGFFAALILTDFKHGNEIDWMPLLGGIGGCIALAFYPGLMPKKQALVINKHGIHTVGYAYHFQERNKMSWDKIRSIQFVEPTFLTSGKLSIINSIGSTENISFPLHTKNQMKEFKDHLATFASEKEIDVRL